MKFFKKKPQSHKDWIEVLARNIEEGKFIEITKEDKEMPMLGRIKWTKYFICGNFELEMWSIWSTVACAEGLKIFFKKGRLDLKQEEEKFLHAKVKDLFVKDRTIKVKELQAQARAELFLKS